MKAKISEKGKAFLKSTQASNALVAAIVNNSNQLFNGHPVAFKIAVREGNSIFMKEVFVQRVTSI